MPADEDHAADDEGPAQAQVSIAFLISTQIRASTNSQAGGLSPFKGRLSIQGIQHISTAKTVHECQKKTTKEVLKAKHEY